MNCSSDMDEKSEMRRDAIDKVKKKFIIKFLKRLKNILGTPTSMRMKSQKK